MKRLTNKEIEERFAEEEAYFQPTQDEREPRAKRSPPPTHERMWEDHHSA